MHETHQQTYICAASMPVCVAGQVKPAREWASIHGIKWQALKMRRYRGLSWTEAFGELKRGPKPRNKTA